MCRGEFWIEIDALPKIAFGGLKGAADWRLSVRSRSDEHDRGGTKPGIATQRRVQFAGTVLPATWQTLPRRLKRPRPAPVTVTEPVQKPLPPRWPGL